MQKNVIHEYYILQVKEQNVYIYIIKYKKFII